MNVAFRTDGLPRQSALVLAGGIAMGAFEAGAYAALDQAGLADSIAWVAGSSIGAVTACIIAGNPPEDRTEALRRFWAKATSHPLPAASFWFGAPADGAWPFGAPASGAWPFGAPASGARPFGAPASGAWPFGAPASGAWRQAYNQASVWQTLWFGRPGLFTPRLATLARAGANDVPALYDLAPMRAQLDALVDFDRLNQGAVRVSLAATDVVGGERVVFDTAHGTMLTADHILASCALLPLFAPVEVEGRLLGDGGLSSNTPLDLVLSDPAARDLRCFVVDLFAPEGRRPHSLAASASRAGDLAFGNQTARLLEAQAREDRLRLSIAELDALLTPEQRAQPEVAAMLRQGRTRPADVVCIGYRAGLDEAGLGKPFDFSSATIADRWRAGQDRMFAALSGPAGTDDAGGRQRTQTAG